VEFQLKYILDEVEPRTGIENPILDFPRSATVEDG
jgi:hypothetical protein